MSSPSTPQPTSGEALPCPFCGDAAARNDEFDPPLFGCATANRLLSEVKTLECVLPGHSWISLEAWNRRAASRPTPSNTDLSALAVLRDWREYWLTPYSDDLTLTGAQAHELCELLVDEGPTPTPPDRTERGTVEEAKRNAMQAIVDGLNEVCRELGIDLEAHLDTTESTALDALIAAATAQGRADTLREVREAVQKMPTDTFHAALFDHFSKPAVLAAITALGSQPLSLIDAVPTPSCDHLTGHCDVRGCEPLTPPVGLVEPPSPVTIAPDAS